jgi:hypothetical protein
MMRCGWKAARKRCTMIARTWSVVEHWSDAVPWTNCLGSSSVGIGIPSQFSTRRRLGESRLASGYLAGHPERVRRRRRAVDDQDHGMKIGYQFRSTKEAASPASGVFTDPPPA